jgi:pimeloyl-ACP methyl ester carboxylesterase
MDELPALPNAWQRLTATRRGRMGVRVVGYGLVLLVAIPLGFSQLLLGTQRQATSPPPAGYREIHVISEGLRLRAWLNPCVPTARPAALIVHGLGDSLESWLEVAQVLRRRGHSVLLLDLRGHGGSAGRYTTLGGRERSDVRAALRYLDERHLSGAGFLLMGASMGAVAVLRAAADDPNVVAVVAEAPFDSYRESVAHHARLLYGLPRWVPWIPLSIAFAEWRAGFDADDVDAVAAASRVRAPLLAICDGADERMPEPVVRRVYDAHPGPKRFWLCPGAGHVGASLHPDYWKEVLGFLEENGF